MNNPLQPTRKLTAKHLAGLREKVVPPIWYWFAGIALFYIWVHSNFVTTSKIYGKALGVFLVLIITFAVVQSIARHRKTFFAVIALLTLVVWAGVTESYRNGTTMLWDAVGAAFGAAAAFGARHALLAIWSRLGVLPRRARYPSTVSLIVAAVFCSWGGISLMARILESQLTTDPTRFASIGERSIAAEETRRWSAKRVGLALSGGGYRAAVFHAGTLHALETLGIGVDALSAVSGGSIIGAYYAAGGDPVRFKNAVKEGRFSLLRQIFSIQNSARLLVPVELIRTGSGSRVQWTFDRGDIQANLLRRALFTESHLEGKRDAREPVLMLAATDLSFGLAIGQLADGFLTLTPGQEGRAYRFDKYRLADEQELFDLADRVAISGAFPVAFPPKPLGITIFPYAASGGPRELRLADGGIFDNLGLDLLISANKLACTDVDCAGPATGWTMADQWRTDVMFTSDAGATFGVETDISTLGALGRAFDVIGLKGGQASRRDLNLVSLSAREIAQGAELGSVFLAAGESSAEKINEKSQRRRFDPRDGYPASVLTAIGKLFPESNREQMNDVVTAYLKASAEGLLHLPVHHKWSRYISRTRTVEDCRKLPPGEISDLPGICEAIEMRALVNAQIRDDIVAFRQIATLDSWPEPELADSVYRLGLLLVYLNWNDLRCAMDAPAIESFEVRSERCALKNLLPSSRAARPS